MPQAIYDYHYGMEAEQYAFFRIPKVLMTEPHFRGIWISACPSRNRSRALRRRRNPRTKLHPKRARTRPGTKPKNPSKEEMRK